eukprot:EG_transcript_2923
MLEVPCLTPSLKQLADPVAYFAQLHATVDAPMVRIRLPEAPPPPGARAHRKRGCEALLRPRLPALQPLAEQRLRPQGEPGVARVEEEVRAPMSWEEFRDRTVEADRRLAEALQSADGEAGSAASSSAGTEHADRVQRAFWRRSAEGGGAPALRCAPVAASLFPAEATEAEPLNFNTFASLLKQLPPQWSRPRLSIGEWGACHPWRPEPQDLYAAHCLHSGGPHTWYAVTAQDGRRLEHALGQRFPALARQCRAFWRHHHCLLTPAVLAAEGLAVYRAVLQEGELLVTFPGVHHCGFNHGMTVMETVNFAPLDWIPFGCHATNCSCAASPNPAVDLRLFTHLMDTRTCVAVYGPWPHTDWLDGDYFVHEEHHGTLAFVRETGQRLYLYYQPDLPGWEISTTLGGNGGCARAFTAAPMLAPVVSGTGRWMVVNPSTAAWEEQEVRVDPVVLELGCRRSCKAERYFLSGSYQLQGVYERRPYFVRCGSALKKKTVRLPRAGEEDPEEYPTLYCFWSDAMRSWQIASQLGSGAARAYNGEPALVPQHVTTPWRVANQVTERWEYMDLSICVRVPQQSPACVQVHFDTTAGPCNLNGWYELGGVWAGRVYYVRRSEGETFLAWSSQRREWQFSSALGTGSAVAYASQNACNPCEVTVEWQRLRPGGAWHGARAEVRGYWERMAVEAEEDPGPDLPLAQTVFSIRGLHDGRPYYGTHPNPGVPPAAQLFLFWSRPKEKWVLSAELGPSDGLAASKEDVPMPWLVTGPWKLQAAAKKGRRVALSFTDCSGPRSAPSDSDSDGGGPVRKRPKAKAQPRRL